MHEAAHHHLLRPVRRHALDALCAQMKEIGYQGLEVACQSHVDVWKIVEDPDYRARSSRPWSATA